MSDSKLYCLCHVDVVLFSGTKDFRAYSLFPYNFSSLDSLIVLYSPSQWLRSLELVGDVCPRLSVLCCPV
jgi:hypothetical protein